MIRTTGTMRCRHSYPGKPQTRPVQPPTTPPTLQITRIRPPIVRIPTPDPRRSGEAIAPRNHNTVQPLVARTRSRLASAVTEVPARLPVWATRPNRQLLVPVLGRPQHRRRMGTRLREVMDLPMEMVGLGENFAEKGDGDTISALMSLSPLRCSNSFPISSEASRTIQKTKLTLHMNIYRVSIASHVLLFAPLQTRDLREGEWPNIAEITLQARQAGPILCLAP